MCFVIEVDIGFNLIAKLFNSSLVWNNPVLIFFVLISAKKGFSFGFSVKIFNFAGETYGMLVYLTSFYKK
jgi:hypothetical protein